MVVRIESLLSARLFLQPQLVDDRIYFLSNMGGHNNLYAMDYGGSVPEPLLPPHIALQNPHLVEGKSFYVFPKLKKILVMIDRDGDENYQPMLIPIAGGFPEPSFNNFFAENRVYLGKCDPDRNIAYFSADSRTEPVISAYQGHLPDGELVKLGESKWGSHPGGVDDTHTRVTLHDDYTLGDDILYLWEQGSPDRKLIYGLPIEQRSPGQQVPLPAFFSPHFLHSRDGIILGTALFCDTLGLGYIDLSNPSEVKPVEITGTIHEGVGEFEDMDHLKENRYMLRYNIDGVTWLYEGELDEANLQMNLQHVICGRGQVSNGVLEAVSYDADSDRFVLSFSTATSPTQIYTAEGEYRDLVFRHTNERILGIPSEWLSPGEDASYISFDGTRVSARLYMPAPELNFSGPRPLVYYIHGGPQGQERPDFAWFSMPLIQFLTLNGFAVFVPNVRGSTGYGLQYAKQVDRDWGGNDRLDHVHAMTKVLPRDPRLDIKHSAVVGRSYGGYMTLTLAGRHPDLWSAAVDMFGPYDLVTFSERIPETWKPYFKVAIGDPAVEADRKHLLEMSPSTYLDKIECPLLVIQGRNDPRVVEKESRDVVERLRAKGKDVEILVFENEGHDVLKFENRVTCYNAITDYFKKHLMKTR